MTTQDDNLIGDFLLNLRLDRELSQSELAKRAGCVSNTISRLEGGLAYPHRGTVAKILSALRAMKELTKQQKKFVRDYLQLPDDYLLDAPESALPPLTMDVVYDRPEVPVQRWIDHTVSEVVSVVGRERALELLLNMASSHDIPIPEKVV